MNKKFTRIRIIVVFTPSMIFSLEESMIMRVNNDRRNNLCISLFFHALNYQLYVFSAAKMKVFCMITCYVNYDVFCKK